MNVAGVSAVSDISAVRESADAVKRSVEVSPDISVPERKNRDEFIPAEEELSAGIYRKTADENGQPGIEYDRPEKSDKAEKCTANTDKVDAEIKQLREKEKALSRELKNAEGEKKALIEKQLAQVQAELEKKDNDTYRRGHAVFS